MFRRAGEIKIALRSHDHLMISIAPSQFETSLLTSSRSVSMPTLHHITSPHYFTGYETTICRCMMQTMLTENVSCVRLPQTAGVRRSCHSKLLQLLPNDNHAFLSQQAPAALSPSTVSTGQPCRCLSNPPFIYLPLLSSLCSSSSFFFLSSHPIHQLELHPITASHHCISPPTKPCLQSTHLSVRASNVHTAHLISTSPLTSRNHARLHHRRHPGHGRLLHGCRPSKPAFDKDHHYYHRRDQGLRSYLCWRRSELPRRPHLCWCWPGCSHSACSRGREGGFYSGGA